MGKEPRENRYFRRYRKKLSAKVSRGDDVYFAEVLDYSLDGLGVMLRNNVPISRGDILNMDNDDLSIHDDYEVAWATVTPVRPQTWPPQTNDSQRHPHQFQTRRYPHRLAAVAEDRDTQDCKRTHRKKYLPEEWRHHIRRFKPEGGTPWRYAASRGTDNTSCI